MNLLAHGLGNSFVEQRNSLVNTSDLLKKFDLILQSIPLPKELTSKREIYQLSETFLKNALSMLADEGRGALLMPISVFNEEAQELWAYIVSNDWLEAVIGLPAKLLYTVIAR